MDRVERFFAVLAMTSFIVLIAMTTLWAQPNLGARSAAVGLEIRPLRLHAVQVNMPSTSDQITAFDDRSTTRRERAA